MVVVFRFRGLVALAMIVSGSLVQVNGAQRSFQAAMKRSMAVMRSATVGKLPRRSAWRVMIQEHREVRADDVLLTLPLAGDVAEQGQRGGAAVDGPQEVRAAAVVGAVARRPGLDR